MDPPLGRRFAEQFSHFLTTETTRYLIYSSGKLYLGVQTLLSSQRLGVVVQVIIISREPGWDLQHDVSVDIVGVS